MTISLIVAVSDNNVIGKSGQIPWRLPAEQAQFKQTTMGHPIIMGRKTHESIGRALPGRYNIVITRQKDYQAKNCKIVNSLSEALGLLEVKMADEVFIIGGSEIYKQALPFVGRLYLTRVHVVVDGDTFFQHNPADWQEIWSEDHPADAENKFGFTLTVSDRKK